MSTPTLYDAFIALPIAKEIFEGIYGLQTFYEGIETPPETVGEMREAVSESADIVKSLIRELDHLIAEERESEPVHSIVDLDAWVRLRAGMSLFVSLSKPERLANDEFVEPQFAELSQLIERLRLFAKGMLSRALESLDFPHVVRMTEEPVDA